MKTTFKLQAPSRVTRWLCAAGLGASVLGMAWADDIDIYSVPPGSSGAPNLMILLDNTSNWSAANNAWEAKAVYDKCLLSPKNTAAFCQTLIEATFYDGISLTDKKRPWTSGFVANKDNVSLTQGQVELRTLKVVFKRMVCDVRKPDGSPDPDRAIRVNVGLTMLSSQSASSNGDAVGVINHAIRGLSNDGADNSTCRRLIDQLDAIDSKIQNPAWKAPSNANYGAAYYEIFKYFGAHTNPEKAIMSPQQAGAPVGATGYGATRFSVINELDDPGAFTDTSRQVYQSPISTSSNCGKNYILLMGNQFPNSEGSGSAPPARMFPDMTMPNIAGGLAANKEREADEWAWFMANTDVSPAEGLQSVQSYTIDVYNRAVDVDQGKLLLSMAVEGGTGPGGYFTVGGDIAELFRALAKILTNIAAVDSVFTATSLPVSTTTQGSYLNQLFVGMFRPDENARPRWWGNLKQYELKLVSTSSGSGQDLIMVGKDGVPAINGSTGFFNSTTVSFWTKLSNFFSNKRTGNDRGPSDMPDGATVEKGGAAQALRTQLDTDAKIDGRRLLSIPLTSTAQSASGFPLLSSSIVGAGGALSSEEVAWVKGLDNVSGGDGDEYFVGETLSGDPLSVRPSIHGDVLHSRPVAVNYGKDARGRDNIVVFYGTNDGLLRAIDGRKNNATLGSATDPSVLESVSDAGKEYWSFLAPEFYPVVRRQRTGSPEILLPTNLESGARAVSLTDPPQEPRPYGMDGAIGLLASYNNTTGNLTQAIIYASMRRGGESVYAFDVTQTASGALPSLLWAVRGGATGFERLGQTWSAPRGVILNRAAYPSVGSGSSATSRNRVVIFGGGYDPAEDSLLLSHTAPTSGKGRALYVVDAITGELRAALTGSGGDAIAAAVAGDVSLVDSNLDGQYDRIYFGDVRGGVYRVDIANEAGRTAAENFAAWRIKKIAQLPGRIFHAPDVIVTGSFVAVMVGTGDREKPLMNSTNEHFFMVKDATANAVDRDSRPVITLARNKMAEVAAVAANGAITQRDIRTADTSEGCYITLATNGEKVVNSPLTVAGTTYFGTNKPEADRSASCLASLGEARAYAFDLFCGQVRSTELHTGGYPPSPVGGLVMIGSGDQSQLVDFVLGSGAGNSPLEATRPNPTVTPARRKNFWRVLPSGNTNR